MVQGEGLWVNPVWALPGAPLRPELCGPHPDGRSCPQRMGAVPKGQAPWRGWAGKGGWAGSPPVKGLYLLKPQFPLCAERAPRLRSALAAGPTGARSTEV